MVIFSKSPWFCFVLKEIKTTVKLPFSKYQNERPRSWKEYFFLQQDFTKPEWNLIRTKRQVQIKRGHLKRKKIAQSAVLEKTTVSYLTSN